VGRYRIFCKAAECAIYSLFKGTRKEAKKMPLFLCENSIVHRVLIMKFELERMKGKLKPQYKVYHFLKTVLNDLNGRFM
jgi:hypothetical protein